MFLEPLRIAAFCAYLAAWAVVVIAAAGSIISRRSRQASVAMRITAPVVVGTLLQGAGIWTTTLTLGDGPLHPKPLELAGALVLAPIGAAIFVWALRSARFDSDAAAILVTGGAYRWLRHPIYLSFLALLAATGLLASSGLRLIVSVGLYLAGSELRIATEELELDAKFPNSYAQYKQRTRWRYLPWLR